MCSSDLVRNLIIDLEINDFDFATKLIPNKVKQKLQQNNIKYTDLAEKFGTIIAIVNKKNFEITTLRKDYQNDGRHCNVKFSTSFFEDAKRRDFTINALYLDQNGVIYDYFDGINHLKNGIICFIGDAKLRIKEDYLRILRFLRFSAKFANHINDEGLKYCIELQNNLTKLSKSRIRDEFIKMIKIDDHKKLINLLQILEKYNFWQILFDNDLQIDNFNNLLSLQEDLKISFTLSLKIATIFLNKNTDISQLKYNLNLTRKEYQYLQFFRKNLNDANYNQIDFSNSFFELLSFNDIYLVRDFCIFSKISNKQINLQSIKEILDFLQDYMVANFPLNGKDVLRLGFKNEEVGLMLKKCKINWLKSKFKMSKKDLLQLIS